jgi:hypothetical protein
MNKETKKLVAEFAKFAGVSRPEMASDEDAEQFIDLRGLVGAEAEAIRDAVRFGVEE